MVRRSRQALGQAQKMLRRRIDISVGSWLYHEVVELLHRSNCPGRLPCLDLIAMEWFGFAFVGFDGGVVLTGDVIIFPSRLYEVS